MALKDIAGHSVVPFRSSHVFKLAIFLSAAP